jgi:membrane-bound lytic murein transglycosylase MltF
MSSPVHWRRVGRQSASGARTNKQRWEIRLAHRTSANIAFLLALLWFGLGTTGHAQEADDSLTGVFPEINPHSTDDLSAMKERKLVRALVTLSKTDFFIYNGQPKGFQAEMLQHYEKTLNKGLSRRELRTRIAYVPVPFSELIPALNEGKGDIAAALLTITPERERQVTFISGRRWMVNEILVTNKSVEGINSVDDLTGRSVYVLRGSSYVEHLKKLNEAFASRMMAPIVIIEADANLLSEDIIELVNAGVVDITVIDDFKALLWAQIFPDVVVHQDIQISSGGYVGWAIRKNNPELEASLEKFLPQVRKRSLLGNILIERYFGTTKWIRNPMDEMSRQKLEGFMALFKEYGDRYGFDWLAVVAQAYQESGLDPNAKSRVGAVGIMQLLPSTAEYVGIPDITEIENNIHAGVKYLSYLRNKYFSDPDLAEIDRFAFTWAAYNAGPSKVQKMRARAKKMELDPNKWFQNVEYAALRLVGQETVTYVANIYKYYVAYALSRDLLNKKAEQLRAIEASGAE